MLGLDDWGRLVGDLLGSSRPARVGRRCGCELRRLGGVDLVLTGLGGRLSSGLDVIGLASYGLLDIGLCLLIGVREVVLLVALGTGEEETGLNVESGAGLVVLGELSEDLLATAAVKLALSEVRMMEIKG